MVRPKWSPQWEPGGRSPAGMPALAFGSDDGPPQVVRLDGGYVPPFPADLVPAPPASKPINVVEPVEGYWTLAGRFGQRFQGEIPDIAGGIIPLLQNQRLPGPPAPWWVSFYRFDRGVLDESGGAPTNSEIRGLITYGAGGVQNALLVDVISGIQLPVVCNTIQIDLVTYAPEADVPYSPASLIAGVMVGKGAGSGALPPTFTTQVFQSSLVGPFTYSQIFPVPDFARSVGLFCDDAAAAFTLTFRARSLNVIKRVTLATCPALLEEKGVPIPAGTNQIELDGAGAGATRAGLQFFLAL